MCGCASLSAMCEVLSLQSCVWGGGGGGGGSGGFNGCCIKCTPEVALATQHKEDLITITTLPPSPSPPPLLGFHPPPPPPTSPFFLSLPLTPFLPVRPLTAMTVLTDGKRERMRDGGDRKRDWGRMRGEPERDTKQKGRTRRGDSEKSIVM